MGCGQSNTSAPSSSPNVGEIAVEAEQRRKKAEASAAAEEAERRKKAEASAVAAAVAEDHSQMIKLRKIAIEQAEKDRLAKEEEDRAAAEHIENLERIRNRTIEHERIVSLASQEDAERKLVEEKEMLRIQKLELVAKEKEAEKKRQKHYMELKYAKWTDYDHGADIVMCSVFQKLSKNVLMGYQDRLLILTERNGRPHLQYVDDSKREIKGEIEWDINHPPVAVRLNEPDKFEIRVKTPTFRAFQFKVSASDDKEFSIDEWVAKIKQVGDEAKILQNMSGQDM